MFFWITLYGNVNSCLWSKSLDCFSKEKMFPLGILTKTIELVIT